MKTSNLTRKYALLMLCIFALIILVTALDLTSFAFAEEVSNARVIKLEYLKRIKDTPFAEKVQKIVKIPVYANHVIKLNDVKKALKCKSFGVMQSYSDTFTYNAETDTYTAVYYKSVYLNAKTVDGNSKNFYLDCNLSFEEYFKPFVDNGTLEQSIYEFYLNNIHIRYPELDGYTADNIFGYFGLIPIPNGRNLNQLWKDLFGETTNYKGILEHYMYSNVLTNSAYKKLLEDYHYSWLEVIWKTFVDKLLSGSVNADFYMVYVDSQTTEAFIAENGATDINNNSGLIFNKAKDFFSEPKNIIALVGIIIGVFVLVGMILAIVLAVKSIAKTVTKEATKNGNRKR